ncbi:MAG: hypothetical protein IMZ62_15895 [Chloroflexi bacterium]|nr:hypothetical protein [Chloroflexota bacterium]
MPIFFFLHSQKEPLVTRGEHLGIWKRILLKLGFAVPFKAAASKDIYYLAQRSISYPQKVSGADIQLRMERQKAAQAAEAKRNPNPGPAPKAMVPKGK